jgi:endonuclease/exonuclease/phosphatase family metal-dependent hydrolase
VLPAVRIETLSSFGKTHADRRPVPALRGAMSGDRADRCLRVLTVNTHKGFTFFNRRFVLHELRDALREVGADLVFLQEVHGSHARHAQRFADWPQGSHYEFMADQIWPEFAYGKYAVYPDGDHGNALLSKYPIVGHHNHDISIDGQEGRGLLHCTVQLPDGEPLHAICVHLGLKEQHRTRQLELLCSVVHNEVPALSPLVIAGDFNDWRNRAHRILERCAGLREVFEQAHGRAAKTFPARMPLLRLDRIYVRNARVHTPLSLPSRPWSRLSDHAPLAAEMSL